MNHFPSPSSTCRSLGKFRTRFPNDLIPNHPVRLPGAFNTRECAHGCSRGICRIFLFSRPPHPPPTPPPHTFQRGGQLIGNVPPTFLPKKRETHIGSAIVRLRPFFSSNYCHVWLNTCVARRTPSESLQRPHTPAASTRCLQQLYLTTDQRPWLYLYR